MSKQKISSLEDAFWAAGFSKLWVSPDKVIGEKFRLKFSTACTDAAEPRKYDRHDLVGTVTGLQWDQSISSLIVEISNTRCGIGRIRSVDYYLPGDLWEVDIADEEGEFAHHEPFSFDIIPPTR